MKTRLLIVLVILVSLATSGASCRPSTVAGISKAAKAIYDYSKSNQSSSQSSSQQNSSQRQRQQLNFGASKKSVALESKAAYEEKWAKDCLEKAEWSLKMKDTYSYNSWISAAKDHAQKAKQLRADAEFEKRYGN